jgi:CDGSH-type Zn-finger protein/uncharacterized Fe-S cluster protein YjdI
VALRDALALEGSVEALRDARRSRLARGVVVGSLAQPVISKGAAILGLIPPYCRSSPVRLTAARQPAPDRIGAICNVRAMARRTGAQRTYSTERIAVHWDSTRCIHTARCLKALPAVFDVRRRPWVAIEAADADAIAAAVETCPTGALRYERLDGAPQEQPVRPTAAIPIDDGPLLVMGDLRVDGPDGETITEEHRLTLCRCGRSRNQPFCDNSHLAGGFRSRTYEARPDAARDSADSQDGGQTRITATRDGSLHFEGHVQVMTPGGEMLADADDLWLCRCGRSNAKPFCDGSHAGRFESRLVEVDGERRRAETPAAFERNLHVAPPPEAAT